MIAQFELSAGLLLGFVIMLGRFAGFVRELTIAAVMGVSLEADAAIVLLTLPDLLVNLLLAGGLSVALIPILKNSNQYDRSLILNQAGLIVLCVFCIFGVVAFIWPNIFFAFLAPGLEMDGLPNYNWIIFFIAASIPLTAISGVTTAGLNSNDKFIISGCGTLIFNLSVIAALWLGEFVNISALLLLGVGVFVGALIRLITQVSSMQNLFNLDIFNIGKWLLGRVFLKNFIIGLMSTSLLILVPVLIRSAASILGPGQLATFNYVLKLVELPVGILIATLATVAYPKLSNAFAKNHLDEFNDILSIALRKTIILSLVVVLCSLQFADPAIRIIFGFEKITFEQRKEISDLLQFTMLSVPFVGISTLLAASLNSKHMNADVLKNSLYSLVLMIFFIFFGVLLKSSFLLAASLIGFYIAFTFFLYKKDGDMQYIRMNRYFFSDLIYILMIFALFACIDYAISIYLCHSSFVIDVAHLMLGAVAFGCMSFYGLSKINS